MSRALVLQGGTMRGAFLVGALKTIYHRLGPEYFDTIISTSVGVFEQAFFAAKQPTIMENTWREYVTGYQLINIANPFRGKPILNLDYLVDLFQSERSRLDLSALRQTNLRLLTAVTDYQTKLPQLIDLKKDIFNIMRATCALPLLYPRPVIIDGHRFVDSYMAPTKKFRELIQTSVTDHSETWAITSYVGPDDSLPQIEHVIRPTVMPLWGSFDTNRGRIISTIEQGEKDMHNFLQRLTSSK